jgi:hypothetical protein
MREAWKKNLPLNSRGPTCLAGRHVASHDFYPTVTRGAPPPPNTAVRVILSLHAPTPSSSQSFELPQTSLIFPPTLPHGACDWNSLLALRNRSSLSTTLAFSPPSGHLHHQVFVQICLNVQSHSCSSSYVKVPFCKMTKESLMDELMINLNQLKSGLL